MWFFFFFKLWSLQIILRDEIGACTSYQFIASEPQVHLSLHWSGKPELPREKLPKTSFLPAGVMLVLSVEDAGGRDSFFFLVLHPFLLFARWHSAQHADPGEARLLMSVRSIPPGGLCSRFLGHPHRPFPVGPPLDGFLLASQNLGRFCLPGG